MGALWERLVREADLCLVDIGARGGSRPAFKRLAPHARLVVCEPEREEADRLAEQSPGALEWREVTFVREAIAQEGPQAVLHVTAKRGLSSLLPPDRRVFERFDQPGFEVVETQVVPTSRLIGRRRSMRFRMRAV